MADDLTLFSTISSDRYAAGRLWSPELSLDLADRDLAMWTQPFSFSMASTSWGGGDTTTTGFYLVFPAQWPQQEGASNLRLRLSLYVGVSVQTLTETAEVGIDGGENTAVTTSTTPVYSLLTKTYSPPFPTGVTAILFRGIQDACRVARVTTRGPDCSLQFYYSV